MIKKICSLAVLFVVGASSFAFAVDKPNKEDHVLTYEKALELALYNSLEVKQTDKRLNKIDKTNKELDGESASLIRTMKYNPQYDMQMDGVIFGLEKAEKEKNLYSRSITYTKELISLAVRNQFNTIDSTNSDMKLCDEQINLKEKELQIANVKKSRGLISKHDYEALQNSLEELKKTKEQKKLGMNKALLELNHYLNLKDIQDYTIRPIAYEYQPLTLKNTEIETKALQASSVNMAVTAKEHGVSLQQLTLDRNLYQGNKAIQQADIYIDETEILKMKEDIRSGVKREYSDLKLLEEKIALLRQQQYNKEQELENEKTKLGYGKVSSFSVEQKELELKEMQHQYNELIKGYEMAKIHFNNLYFSGSSL